MIISICRCLIENAAVFDCITTGRKKWSCQYGGIVDSILQMPLIRTLKENLGAELWNFPLAEASCSLMVRVVAQPHGPGWRDIEHMSAITFPPSHSHDPNCTFRLRLLLCSLHIVQLQFFSMLSPHWSNYFS